MPFLVISPLQGVRERFGEGGGNAYPFQVGFWTLDLGLRILSKVGRKSVSILVRILDIGLVIYSKQKENIHSSLDLDILCSVISAYPFQLGFWTTVGKREYSFFWNLDLGIGCSKK